MFPVYVSSCDIRTLHSLSVRVIHACVAPWTQICILNINLLQILKTVFHFKLEKHEEDLLICLIIFIVCIWYLFSKFDLATTHVFLKFFNKLSKYWKSCKFKISTLLPNILTVKWQYLQHKIYSAKWSDVSYRCDVLSHFGNGKIYILNVNWL